MKRFAVAAVAIFIAATASAQNIRGAWTASSEDADRIHVNMSRRHHQNGQTMRVADFQGLTASQIRSAASTPVQFSLNRDAGTVAFEGSFRDGYGGGQFTFTPNQQYLETLRSLGVQSEESERDEKIEERLLQLAVHDVSVAYIRSMQAEGYRVSLEKYVAFRIFRVTPELVREFRALGFDKIDADDLVSSQVHKVTPAYVREMRAAGFRSLSLDDLVSSRVHKATPEFLGEMKTLGYGDIDFDEMIAFRVHKVTPEFVRELRELGYSNISADDLISMRVHKVTPAFIKELREAGYSNIPIEKLISMRVHGIDAKFVRKMNKQ
jgi:hypothetical protein